MRGGESEKKPYALSGDLLKGFPHTHVSLHALILEESPEKARRRRADIQMFQDVFGRTSRAAHRCKFSIFEIRLR
jgi:hypothetical protein